jgi:hypothetical protein
MMSDNDILKVSEPFSTSELERMGISVKKTDLERLVKEGMLKKKKLGRMNIYWNQAKRIHETKSGLESYSEQLELEIKELKHELQAERDQVRKLSIQDGIDEPWKEAAMAMARILSEQKQVSLQEVLEYFNAPTEIE